MTGLSTGRMVADVVRRVRWLVAATLAGAAAGGGIALAAAGKPQLPPGTIDEGVQVPAPGSASVYQFNVRLSGGTKLPTAMAPAGTAMPTGDRLYVVVAPAIGGTGIDVDVVLINPFSISAAAPTGFVHLWLVPPKGETITPGSAARSAPNINQWGLGYDHAFVKSAAAEMRYKGAEALELVGHSEARVAPKTRDRLFVTFDELMRDKPTTAAQAMALGLPYLKATQSTAGGPTTFTWGDINGPPDSILLTGFETQPVLSGPDAGECRPGARGTEHFELCKPTQGQHHLILAMKAKGLLGAVYENQEEFGPFRIPEHGP